MRSAGTKLSKEEYGQLKDYAEAQGTTVSELLRGLVQGVTRGEVQPRFRKDSGAGVRGKIPLCPRCDHLMFYYFARSEMACPNCGYYFEIDEPQWQRGEAIKI